MFDRLITRVFATEYVSGYFKVENKSNVSNNTYSGRDSLKSSVTLNQTERKVASITVYSGDHSLLGIQFFDAYNRMIGQVGNMGDAKAHKATHRFEANEYIVGVSGKH